MSKLVTFNDFGEATFEDVMEAAAESCGFIKIDFQLSKPTFHFTDSNEADLFVHSMYSCYGCE